MLRILVNRSGAVYPTVRAHGGPGAAASASEQATSLSSHPSAIENASSSTLQISS